MSAQSDSASSRRQGKKRPREVSDKRLVSEAGGSKHDVTSKQHNGEAHRSFQVISEKMSHDTPRPKVGPTVDLRMSDADMNDLRFEALASRINKVESCLEEIVHHITVNDSRHVTVSPPKKRKVETTTETPVIGLGPLPQLVVQNRTYKRRTQMTTQFPFWQTKISVIKKNKTLVMKPRITHNIFLILNQI